MNVAIFVYPDDLPQALISMFLLIIHPLSTKPSSSLYTIQRISQNSTSAPSILSSHSFEGVAQHTEGTDAESDL